MEPEHEQSPSWREQLGIISDPKNLLKTIASQVPIASAGTEILNQLEGHQTKLRIDSMETELRRLAEIQRIDTQQPATPAPFLDWSKATGEFLTRTVDFYVVYDGMYDPTPKPERELFKTVGHGCVIEKGKILTCREAIDLATSVATTLQGKLVIAQGMIWYEFEIESTSEISGLVTCRINNRVERIWNKLKEAMSASNSGEPTERMAKTAVIATVSPWMGQELGFLYRGEADDMSNSWDWSSYQFDSSVLSYFKRIRKGCLKSFVTGVLPSRIIFPGSPVFSRDSTLLGIISDSFSLKSDAGRRMVVRSLLGHPLFTRFQNLEK